MQQIKFTPKQIRESKKLSQKQMSNYLGISREHYSRIERNSLYLRKTKIDIVISLAHIGEIKLDAINFFY